MAVFTRLVRLVRADMHGVMDQLEDKGLLMRQHLREMEASVEAKQARLAELETSRRQAETQRQRTLAEAADLESDLDLALSKGKDELGRMLIRKLLPLRSRAEGLAARLEEMESESEQLSKTLAEQQAQLAEVRDRVRQALRDQQAQRQARDLSWLPESDPDQPHTAQQEAMVELELLKRKEHLETMETAGQGRAS